MTPSRCSRSTPSGSRPARLASSKPVRPGSKCSPSDRTSRATAKWSPSGQRMSDARRLGGEVLRFATQADFEAWLADNHARSAGVWLEIAKKNSPDPTVTYAEAIESALCFGWIDGQKRGGNDEHWLQRFTPRSSRSRWSRINRDKAAQLIAAGRMRPAGLTEVDRARVDSRWAAAYEGQRGATIPDDLAHELDRDPKAAAAFA